MVIRGPEDRYEDDWNKARRAPPGRFTPFVLPYRELKTAKYHAFGHIYCSNAQYPRIYAVERESTSCLIGDKVL